MAIRGVDCEGLVGEAILESHIAWGITWRCVLIRSDLPSMCRGLFSHYCMLWGRTKLRGLGPKAENIYTIGVGPLQLLLENPMHGTTQTKI